MSKIYVIYLYLFFCYVLYSKSQYRNAAQVLPVFDCVPERHCTVDLRYSCLSVPNVKGLFNTSDLNPVLHPIKPFAEFICHRFCCCYNIRSAEKVETPLLRGAAQFKCSQVNTEHKIYKVDYICTGHTEISIFHLNMDARNFVLFASTFNC